VRIVLDTNVLVSGLLSPLGPPGRIVDLVVAERVTVLFDDRIVSEYRDVLARPRLRIHPADAAAVLDLIVRGGQHLPAPPLDVELPDPDDAPFLEVAVAAAADALVTGNERHYRPVHGEHFARVRTPAAFLAEFTRLHPQG
jgi:uncharacterized protein